MLLATPPPLHTATTPADRLPNAKRQHTPTYNARIAVYFASGESLSMHTEQDRQAGRACSHMAAIVARDKLQLCYDTCGCARPDATSLARHKMISFWLIRRVGTRCKHLWQIDAFAGNGLGTGHELENGYMYCTSASRQRQLASFSSKQSPRGSCSASHVDHYHRSG